MSQIEKSSMRADQNVVEIVATEVAAAAAVGGSISGEKICQMHRLDGPEVASAIRYLLRNGHIHLVNSGQQPPR